ncbi:MAG: deoxyribodipyrimidine photo-lyase [Patescibacteria group bacterium]
MNKPYNRGLFLFRRDLRLEDNLGLLALLEQCEEVIPAFIFDPRQIDREQNHYFSEPAFQFLLNSLQELDDDLKARGSQLYIFDGDPAEVTQQLIEKDVVDVVFVNKDYTPFSRTRDKAIADVCEEANIPFERHHDAVLAPIETIRTGQDKLYTVFTPFMRNAATHAVPEPRKNNFSNYFSAALTTRTVPLSEYTADTTGMELALAGGRSEALAIMRDPVFLNGYKDNRNWPGKEKSTSRLSAHHKFGTISIRESYQLAAEHSGKGSHFISELYWRDFYYYTAYHFPIVFKQSFLPWAKHIKWINNKEQFAAWCEGRTGVPMVDAGMRELNHTGWMHNRSRMIVASYLTKNLLIDWRWGEQYFASKLLDYDPAQNNGGWQWSASVGTDPRPLRIFNAYTQAVNYDPDAIYIKQWIQELRDVDPKKLADGKTQDLSELAPDYPAPIEDQKSSYHRTMEVYKAAKDKWKQEKIAENS